jgi:hypothetical protein
MDDNKIVKPIPGKMSHSVSCFMLEAYGIRYVWVAIRRVTGSQLKVRRDAGRARDAVGSRHRSGATDHVALRTNLDIANFLRDTDGKTRITGTRLLDRAMFEERDARLSDGWL